MTRNLKNQRIAILGAGRSGVAAARLAQREGAELKIFDSAPAERFSNFPSDLPLHASAKAADGKDFAADLVVISPGIPTDCEFVRSFSCGQAPVIGEVELAAPFFTGKVIGITGTNGKTTTTELVEHMLIEGGFKARACGNYGLPLAEIVTDHSDCDAVALELSSFQLESIDMLRPDVAIWLNFSPDHMDRYRDIEEYRSAKQRIFQNQNSDDWAIIRSGEQTGPIAAQTLSFSNQDPNADFTLQGRHIHFRGKSILDLNTTQMRGKHNAENVMAALGCLHALGLPFETGRRAAKGFAPPLHRCELIRTLDGIEWINDSKATNLDALRVAVASQDRPVVLLAGGKEKGLEYGELLPDLKAQVHFCITFGEIGPKLHACFASDIPSECVETLEQAVALAQQKAPLGSTVLLSPGTSSFDQFEGYESRGDTFRKAVLKLP